MEKSYLFPFRHLRQDRANTVPADPTAGTETTALGTRDADSGRPSFGYQPLPLSTAIAERGFSSYQIHDRFADRLTFIPSQLASFQQPGGIDEDFRDRGLAHRAGGYLEKVPSLAKV